MPAGKTLPFRLYLISDRGRMGPDPVGAAVRLAEAGLGAFQWREKDLSPGENHRFLRDLSSRLRGTAGLYLFVNDRADLALSLELHIHLTESSMPTRAVRDLLPPGTLLARSSHSLASARAAAEEGADFVTFGPVYDTASKRAYGPPRGIEALAEVCAGADLPVLALGGVTAGRVGECLKAGAAGVAMIGAVWDAPDPALALKEVLRNLGEEPR